VKKSKDRKAAKVLAKIHRTSIEEVQAEIKDIQSTVVQVEKEEFGHVLRLLSTRGYIQRFDPVILTYKLLFVVLHRSGIITNY
jgi:Ribonuclease G/E